MSLKFPLQGRHPWGVCPGLHLKTTSSMWKTNYAVTQIPSGKVRLIKWYKYSGLPTAVAYTQTRVMSYKMSSVLRNSVKWITYHRAISNLC